MVKIKRIKELLEEYADCRAEMDLGKTAVEIAKLFEPTHNAEPSWQHLQNILGVKNGLDSNQE